MFIGHFAVGFAAKKFAPRTSLAPLLAAPLFLDILWPIFLLLDIEHVRIAPGDTRFTPLDLYDYPWSHSLLMACVWATAFALPYFGVARYRPGAMALLALYVAIQRKAQMRTSRATRDRIDRFSPPPTSPGEIARTGVVAEVVLLVWAWWFDHHRAAHFPEARGQVQL